MIKKDMVKNYPWGKTRVSSVKGRNSNRDNKQK